ncbi:DUF3667 domain-containing protein [Pontibacter sp. G13]|uniref:DUF3667 domain-containing protein n=1 Tax=Pontibacter sp. G13 TaxID=3074898 RepID=UPI00288B0013|nr:DUF3667 domain-containing protein [Pontibacter sp. G13]WNJ19164.1 DUF3667 domain-containing protein [Pontibacter sp. G13]
MSQPAISCYHCEKPITGNFCAHCGKPKSLERIDGRYVMSEFRSIVNFDKGILFTIWELLLRPGANIHHFMHHDRNRLVKPIIFLITASLIYSLLQQILHFEDGYMSFSGTEESATIAIFAWIQKNYGYANLLMAIFIAWWIKLFFRKYAYNYFEILILLCFIMGMGMLMYTAFGLLESLTSWKVLQIGGIFGMLYAGWAIARFFDKSRFWNYAKGIFAYLLGFLTFSIAALVLGLAIDWISK